MKAPDKNGFTWNVQLAGYAFEQVDEKGPIDYEGFVREFRRFPWASQVGRANGRCEPTLSVRSHSNGTDCWVSAIKHGAGHVYLVGVVHTREKRGLFGLGSPKPVRWVEIYVAEVADTVEKAFRTFFGGNPEMLLSELRALPKFDEMEARK